MNKIQPLSWFWESVISPLRPTLGANGNTLSIGEEIQKLGIQKTGGRAVNHASVGVFKTPCGSIAGLGVFYGAVVVTSEIMRQLPPVILLACPLADYFIIFYIPFFVIPYVMFRWSRSSTISVLLLCYRHTDFMFTTICSSSPGFLKKEHNILYKIKLIFMKSSSDHIWFTRKHVGWIGR